jgi:undecaprenyl-diphosphatase
MGTTADLPPAARLPTSLVCDALAATSYWWRFGIAALAAAYAALIAAVLTASPLVRLDWQVLLQRPYLRWPSGRAPLNLYVIAGQRGPSAIAALAWLTWRSWRTRSLRPLLVLALSLLLLNATVGAVKLALGRLGPHYSHVFGSAELFQGGASFPSGHTANAVITWGTLAYLATRRRVAAAAATFIAATVGLATLYLGTHWVSDVLAGWAAGGLVLLALPLGEPLVAHAEEKIQQQWAHLKGRHVKGPVLVRDRVRALPDFPASAGNGLPARQVPRPAPPAPPATAAASRPVGIEAPRRAPALRRPSHRRHR